MTLGVALSVVSRGTHVVSDKPSNQQVYADDSIAKLIADMDSAANAADSSPRDGVAAFVRQWMDRLKALTGETPPATKTAVWSATLRAEIAAQERLIKRMHDDHHDTQGNGIMGQLRAERLELLRELLKFESQDA